MPAKRTLTRLGQKYIFWDEMPFIINYDCKTDMPKNEADLNALLKIMQCKIKVIAKVIKGRTQEFEFDDIIQMTEISTLKLMTTYDCKKSLWATYWNNNIIRAR